MKKLNVRGIDFHLSGYQTFIEVKDQEHLDALLYFYGKGRLVLSSSRGGGGWEHSAPVLVHAVEVPKGFVDGELDAENARAVLQGARGSAEEAADRLGTARRPYRFDLMGGSADGNTIHVVVWEQWIDNAR